LIDKRGTHWPAGSHPIAGWQTTIDPIDYAVRELGFVKVRAYPGKSVEVRLNPHRVGELAIVTLMYLLFDTRPRRLVLAHGVEREIFKSLTPLVDRLGEFLAQTRNQKPNLTARHLSLDHPRGRFRGKIEELTQGWRERRGLWRGDEKARFQQIGVFDDTVIVARRRDSDRMLIEHWGSARDLVGKIWTQLAVGRDVADHPLSDLNSWVLDAYEAALAAGRPYLHDVDVVAPQPDGHVTRRRYDRLLLPWHGKDGEVHLTTTTFTLDTTPDLHGRSSPRNQAD
jgi:hypothetical protein